MSWGAVITAVGTVGGALISSQGNDKKVRVPEYQPVSLASQDPDNFPELAQVDTFDTAARTNAFNQQQGIPDAITASGEINQDIVDQLGQYMAQLFGASPEEFEALQDLNIEALEAQLQGELSPGTRRQLGQAAVSANLTELGPASVDTAFTGFVGITAEQQTQAGQSNFRGLYALYRQSAPIASPLDLLSFTGLSTGQALQMEAQNASFANQNALAIYAGLQNADALNVNQAVSTYNARYTGALADSKNPNAGLYGALGAGVAQLGTSIGSGIGSGGGSAAAV